LSHNPDAFLRHILSLPDVTAKPDPVSPAISVRRFKYVTCLFAPSLMKNLLPLVILVIAVGGKIAVAVTLVKLAPSPASDTADRLPLTVKAVPDSHTIEFERVLASSATGRNPAVRFTPPLSTNVAPHTRESISSVAKLSPDLITTVLSVPAPTFGIAMVASSNVVVPPAESIVRLPDDVSISFAPVTPIRILLPQTPAVPSTVANVTLSPAHNPRSIAAAALPSCVSLRLPCTPLLETLHTILADTAL